MYYVSILMVGDCRQVYAGLSVGRCHESVLGQTYILAHLVHETRVVLINGHTRMYSVDNGKYI